MTDTFTYSGLRVRFHEVDHAGIVFFAQIFTYCHVAYEEFIEQEVGMPPDVFFEMNDLGAPLVATESQHLHILRHGDRLRIRCWVEHLGRSSMAMRYEVYNQDDTLCAKVVTRHVFITRSTMRSVPIPDSVRPHLERFYHPPAPTETP